jgi:hypothetical protein
MKATVTLGSGRPGGIDISLAGLAAQTFDDFEVVFVDGRYHKRHRQVMEAVSRSGLKQPFYHVPNHRYRTDPLGSSSAGFNTGFMLAAGEIVVMLMDYAFAPPDWLANHVAHPERKIKIGPIATRLIDGVVSKDGGPFLRFDGRQNIDGLPFEEALGNIVDARERFDEISVFEKPFKAEQLSTFKSLEPQEPRFHMSTGASTWAHFYTKNESFPREAILAVNGMNEDCDRSSVQGDIDLGLRLSRHLSATPWIVHEAYVECIDPRPFLLKPVCAMTNTDVPPPPFDRFLPAHHPASVSWFQRRQSDRKLVRAENPYDLSERSKEIWEWRDLSQREECLIPRNEVSDENYYQGELR